MSIEKFKRGVINMLKLNLKHTKIDEKELMKYREKVQNAHRELHEIANKEDEFARMGEPSYKF